MQSQIELMLTVMCRSQARFSTQNPENYNVPGELPEIMQYLAMYTYGLLKTPLLSPISQVASTSQYLDSVAEMKYLVNSMSPEEVLPMFYPQIYNVNNADLNDQEWPEVSFLEIRFPMEFTI